MITPSVDSADLAPMVFVIAACLLLLALLNPVLVNHKSPEELPGRNASG